MKFYTPFVLLSFLSLARGGDVLGDVGGAMTKGIGGALGHGCLKLEDAYKKACELDPKGDVLFKCFAPHQSAINQHLEKAGVEEADTKKMNEMRKKCKATACDPQKAKTCGQKEAMEFKKKYEEKAKKAYFANQEEFTKLCSEVEECLKGKRTQQSIHGYWGDVLIHF